MIDCGPRGKHGSIHYAGPIVSAAPPTLMHMTTSLIPSKTNKYYTHKPEN